jgi:hypothetical protein
MKKKTWTAPELLVMVRNNPEESTLTACKVGAIGPNGGMNSQKNYCAFTFFGGCSTCTSISPS